MCRRWEIRGHLRDPDAFRAERGGWTLPRLSLPGPGLPRRSLCLSQAALRRCEPAPAPGVGVPTRLQPPRGDQPIPGASWGCDHRRPGSSLLPFPFLSCPVVSQLFWEWVACFPAGFHTVLLKLLLAALCPAQRNHPFCDCNPGVSESSK